MSPLAHAISRDFDLTRLTISVRVDFPSRSLEGNCALQLRALRSGLGQVRLDAAELAIVEVRLADQIVPHSHSGHDLWIDLDDPVEAGQHLELEVAYRATPRRGLYFAGDDPARSAWPTQAWTYNQPEDARAWFPTLDRPDVRPMTEVIATVPAHLRVLSNGRALRDDIVGDVRVAHWTLDAPIPSYLVALVVADVVEIAESSAGVELAYYAAPERVDDVRRTCGRTGAMMEVFTRLFGSFPYSRFAQVFVEDFWPGGMEHTTLVTLAADGLLDERTAVDFDLDVYIAHELVHHWFGNLVTCSGWGEAWIQEGFGTYAQYLWREHAEGADHAAIELDAWSAAYLAECADGHRRALVPTGTASAAALFDRHLYEKSGRVIHMLRRLLGDEPFFAAARHFIAVNRHGIASTADLQRSAEEVSGRELAWFFDQWVRRDIGYPRLSLWARWDAPAGCVRLRVEQTPAERDRDAVFRLPATVRLVVAGREIDAPLAIVDRCHEFALPAAEEPSQVVFDPGKHLLASVTWRDRPAAWWLAEACEAREPIDRIHAVRLLAGADAAAHRAVARRLLGDDPFWAVRAAAAAALAGPAMTSSEVDALAAALEREPDARARRAMVSALGRPDGEAKAARALAALLERGDPSAFVEADACIALARTGWPGAARALQSVLPRGSYRSVIRAAALTGLADTRDADVLPLLADACREGRPYRERCAALRALARMVAGQGETAAKREALDLAVAALGQANAVLQWAAVDALETLGGERAVATLREALDRDMERGGRVGRQCQRAIDAIGRNSSASPRSESIRSKRTGGDDRKVKHSWTASLTEDIEADKAAMRAREV